MKSGILKIKSDRNPLNLALDLSIKPAEGITATRLPEGYNFFSVTMSQDAPHNGELHPDGDELIYVCSGRVRVKLELDPDEYFDVEAGEAIVIPKGVWHKIHIIETAHLVAISPGPGFAFREL